MKSVTYFALTLGTICASMSYSCPETFKYLKIEKAFLGNQPALSGEILKQLDSEIGTAISESTADSLTQAGTVIKKTEGILGDKSLSDRELMFSLARLLLEFDPVQIRKNTLNELRKHGAAYFKDGATSLIKQKAEDLKITQSKLADAANVTQKQMSLILSNSTKRTSGAVGAIFCEMLGLEVEDLFESFE